MWLCRGRAAPLAEAGPPGRTRLPPPLPWRHFALCTICLLLLGLPIPARAQVTNATVVEIEGPVVMARAGSDFWAPATAGAVLQGGDRLRTVEKSRAVIRLSDLSLIRLGEFSYIEIPTAGAARGGLKLLRGLLYYFHRDKAGVMPVTTPSAHAVVLGTEFVVVAWADGATDWTMLDGSLALTNEFGGIRLTNGESASAKSDAAPRRRPGVPIATAIQWVLYYPGVLDVSELTLPPEAQSSLAESWAAYGQGDLRQALALVPPGRVAREPGEAVYLASLHLTAGLVADASRLLETPMVGLPSTNAIPRLAGALRRLIELVRTGRAPEGPAPVFATEWLVESLARQARSDLSGALVAARVALRQSPGFAFAWTQVGELEFSLGRTGAAEGAVGASLALAPRQARGHGLKGFLAAARGDQTGARTAFDHALALDGAQGDAWLGRGLVRFHSGELDAGLADLQTAVVVEPQRGILRSYLGKAQGEVHDLGRARRELDLARRFDPADPTVWLYSALLRQQHNEINRGIAELETSKKLNDGRSVFRSRLLLDQDRAVRSANLAALYRDAGMAEYAAREAATATEADYANASAHLFLADSYSGLRDPGLSRLRYETPAVSEYLLANVLSPVGASALAPMISQQEYSPLFDRQRVGLSADTRYSSDGSWDQRVAHLGVLDGVAYALEGAWRGVPGHRPNTDLEQWLGAGHFKVQLSPATSIYLLASWARIEAGDTRPYYDERLASPTLRVREQQEPNVFFGVHHQWVPGLHTVFLGAHLDDSLRTTEPSAAVRTLVHDSAGVLTGVLNPADSRFGLRYRTDFEAWSGELLQIWQSPRHLVLAGSRIQAGDLNTRAVLDRDPTAFPPVFNDPAADQRVNSPLDRLTAYAYWHWRILDHWRVIAGGSYDRLRHPINFDAAPIAAGSTTTDQWSPKAALLWTPLTNLTWRAAYRRSLGGLSYDNSIRLEPAQLAGFVQSDRSLVPESRSGLVPGTEFETLHLGAEWRLVSRTYLLAAGEVLRSAGRRWVGVFDYRDAPPFIAGTGRVRESLNFEERSVAVGLHQLLGEEWAISARYRLAAAELRTRVPALPEAFDSSARADEEAWLHEVDLAVRYFHACGWFAGAEARWRSQDNRRDAGTLRDDDFWQFDVWTGWRLAQRRVELSVGALNLTGRNYRLNPLNAAADLPRERLLALRVRWSF